MPSRRLKLTPTAAELVEGFDRIRTAMHLPQDFPKDVVDEAEAAARRKPEQGKDHRPRTDIDFVTIDPPGSRDLDQALHSAPKGDGFIVHYAIADPGWFIAPGGAIDRESRLRGQTLYAPDGRVRLYPLALSERAASLLEGEVRPAVLWEMSLDDRGELVSVEVERALISSRQQMSYEEAQQEIDSGKARVTLSLLSTVGRLRQDLERERGGVHLELPEQEVLGPPGEYRLVFRGPLPVEEWNAQISLMTGMAAARLMIDGRVGLLRTMPAPDAQALEQVRRSAGALQCAWSEDVSYQGFLRSLDPARPGDAALMHMATRLFRGAGYVAFDGPSPAQASHHAIAAPYAHVTAPLRRLADRFANEVVLALCKGQRPPRSTLESLPQMPGIMDETHDRSGEFERRVVDFVEAAVLEPYVGEEFDAVVVEASQKSGTVQLENLAILAQCRIRGLELGARVRVRLTGVDPPKGRIDLELVA